MTRVVLPASLRPFTGGETELDLDVAESTNLWLEEKKQVSRMVKLLEQLKAGPNPCREIIKSCLLPGGNRQPLSSRRYEGHG